MTLPGQRNLKEEGKKTEEKEDKDMRERKRGVGGGVGGTERQLLMFNAQPTGTVISR